MTPSTDREIRRRPEVKCDCPRCGKRVTLYAETHEWTQRRDGQWEHFGYGPAAGECCGLLFADVNGRVDVYKLQG